MENNTTQRGGEYVYDALVHAGIELLVGLPGTQTLPLDRTVVERNEITYLMARHETAIPHIAWGYYESSGKIAATLTVPGPGDTNVMHGLKNALEDCVPIVHVSADVDLVDRGKGPIHEIEADTFDNVVKENITITSRTALREQVTRGITTALTPPFGPVRLGIPSGLLDSEFYVPPADMTLEGTSYDNQRAYEAAVDLLASAERPVVYAGGGARRSKGGDRVVRELANTLNAPVILSYKGKGTYPEDEPRFLGVTGSPIPAGARRALEVADVILALGTDFDGVTTDHWSVPMGDRLIHVNIDAGEFDAGYKSDVKIVADVTEAGDHLINAIGPRRPRDKGWDGRAVATAVQTEYHEHLVKLGLFKGGAPANTPELLQGLREVIPREAVITTDVGGCRLWAKQVFEAYRPDEYITAGSWAGMGVGLPAAIGAKMANPQRPVVCLTGDGGLMMCIHELHTAVEAGLDVIVVVFNNRDYGIISKSPKIEEYSEGHQFSWNSPSFEAIARGFGCDGVTVETAEAGAEAVEKALKDQGGPIVIDVAVQTHEPSAIQAASYESTVDLT